MLGAAFPKDITEQVLETYWAVLRRLPIAAVVWACEQACTGEHFPVPLTLRCLAVAYRDRRAAQQAQYATTQIPARTETTDEESLAALRAIRQRLGDAMAFPRDPVYATPSDEDPETRRARLLQQVRQVMDTDTEKGA